MNLHAVLYSTAGQKYGLSCKTRPPVSFLMSKFQKQNHRGPAQSVWVADCYFIVNVLDLPFASPIAVNRQLCI